MHTVYCATNVTPLDRSPNSNSARRVGSAIGSVQSVAMAVAVAGQWLGSGLAYETCV